MKKKYYFGIDVGATNTKMALVDESCRIIAKRQISSRGFSRKLFFIKQIKENFDSMIAHKKVSVSQIKGIGIGLPGPVDFYRGVVLSLTNITGWKNFHLASFLKKRFALPIYIENDANCMALAESRIGAAKGASFALCLTLGTGVGGGIILDNEIYRGPYFLGGEVGHIPVAFAPLKNSLKGSTRRRCACGGFDCLERFVGNRSIIARVKRDFKRGVPLEEISKMAKAGHRKAVKIWEDVGQCIGFAVSGIVNVLNPQVIVVGGGVSLAGNILLRSIQRSVRRHAMHNLKRRVKIRRAMLGSQAGVLGAALLVKEKIEALH